MCKLDYYGNIDNILAATDLLRGCSYTILHAYGYWYQYGNTIRIGYGYETIYEVLGNIASTYFIVFICWYKIFYEHIDRQIKNREEGSIYRSQ